MIATFEKEKNPNFKKIAYYSIFSTIIFSLIFFKCIYAFDYGNVVIKRVILPKNIMPGAYFSAKLLILNKKDTSGTIKLIAKMPAFYNYENISLKGNDLTIVSIVLKAPQNPTPCIFKLEYGNKIIDYTNILITPNVGFLSLNCPKIVESKYFRITGILTKNDINTINIYVDGNYFKSVKTELDGTFETEVDVKNYGRHKITVSFGRFTSSCTIYVAKYSELNRKKGEKKVNMLLSSKILPLEKCGKSSIEYAYVNSKNINERCHIVISYPKNENLFISAPINRYLGTGHYTFPIYIAGDPSKKVNIKVYLKCNNEFLGNDSFEVLPVNYCRVSRHKNEKIMTEWENIKNTYILGFVFLGISFVTLSLLLIHRRKNVYKENDFEIQDDIIFASQEQIIE